jgi:hypothetical protein
LRLCNGEIGDIASNKSLWEIPDSDPVVSPVVDVDRPLEWRVDDPPPVNMSDAISSDGV